MHLALPISLERGPFSRPNPGKALPIEIREPTKAHAHDKGHFPNVDSRGSEKTGKIPPLDKKDLDESSPI